VPVGSTATSPAVTSGEAENLVSGGMMVMEVIHTIPPLRGPSVLTELALHSRSISGAGVDMAANKDPAGVKLSAHHGVETPAVNGAHDV
jgi:hypothetical protein